MPDPDAFGVETVVGAEEVEATLMLAGSSAKPGGGAEEVWKRDTPVAMPAGTGVRGTPPKTWMAVAGPTPEPLVGRTPGTGRMLEKGAAGIAVCSASVCDAGVFPSELRKAVKSSLGSGGRGGMTLIQVFGHAASQWPIQRMSGNHAA